MYIPNFMRDPGAEGGGGTLQDLFDGVAGANPADLAAAQAIADAQAALKVEATNDDGSLKPGYIADAAGVITKDENYVAPVEGLNADGTAAEGYELVDGKPVKIEAGDDDAEDDEDEDDPVVEAKKFYEAVTAITGLELDVTYPPEITDPISPEGVAFRDNVLIEAAIARQEEFMEQKYPRAYAYLVHTINGGTEEEFMNGGQAYQLPEQTAFDASADLQASVYKFDLRSKGLGEEEIEALTKAAITANKLKEKATNSFNYIKTEQAKQLEQVTQRNEDIERKRTEDIGAMVNKIGETITKEIGFVVPQTDIEPFKKFFIDNMRYAQSTGTFVLEQEIKPENLKAALEAAFFQFKKGDLKTLVEKQSRTQATKSMRLRTNKPATGGKSGAAPAGSQSGSLPLSSVFPTGE